MNSKILKRVIIGILGMLLSISIFVLATESMIAANKWVNYILIAIGAGGFMGSLMYIFTDLGMFFYGMKLGTALVTFVVLTKELPFPYKAIFIVICIVIFLAGSVVKDYFIDREKNSETPRIKRLAKKIKEEEEFAKELEEYDREFLASIAFGEKSLLLRGSNGNYYQCIKGVDKYYFIYIGGSMYGMDSDLVKTDFSKEETFIGKKKDFVVNKRDIHLIKYNGDKVRNFQLDNSGSMVIEGYNLKKKFIILGIIELERTEAFFQGIKLDVKRKKIKNQAKDMVVDNEKPDMDKGLVERLKLVFIFLTVLSIVASAAFLFFLEYYKIMSSLCIVLFISIFALYIKYNDIFSMNDEKYAETFSKGKIKIVLPLLILSGVLGFSSVLAFTLLSYEMFAVFSVLLFLVILFFFFRFTNEYKRKKWSILSIIFIALVFAPSAVVQINYILDTSKAAIVESKIYNMRISKGSDEPDEYLVKVAASNGKIIEFNVSKEYYENHSIGDTAVIREKKGFLSIPYGFIKQK